MKRCAYRIISELAEKEWKRGHYEEADRLEKIASGIARGN